MEFVLVVLMAVSFVAFVGEPLLRRTPRSDPATDDQAVVEQLTLQKETVYTAIRDLEFDYQTGKVDQNDYAELRRQLEDDAVQLLRQLDAVDPLAALDDELERQILALRQQASPGPDDSLHGSCPGCAAVLQGHEKFCPACGQPLPPSPEE